MLAVDVSEVILAAWITSALVMAGLWWVQLRTRNAGWVDFGWTLCTGGIGLWYVAGGGSPAVPRFVLAAMLLIWTFRLGLLLWGRLVGEDEDSRYVALRAHWGEAANRNHFLLFQGQALLALVLAVPFYVAATRSGPNLSVPQMIGVALFAIGWIGVWIADRQKDAFRSRPENKGQVCDIGLWKYSRHPNYFFEWILWCGFGLYGFVGGAWISCAAPLVMLVLLVWVTGIPPSQRQALKRRGELYREYMKKTSPFVPWPPRQSGTRSTIY